MAGASRGGVFFFRPALIQTSLDLRYVTTVLNRLSLHEIAAQGFPESAWVHLMIVGQLLLQPSKHSGRVTRASVGRARQSMPRTRNRKMAPKGIVLFSALPYINVHNYHQKYRRSAEALYWNALAVARSDIGSNRQNRANRFLTVVQYTLDMSLALREMARVARRGARLILVLGRESSVREELASSTAR